MSAGPLDPDAPIGIFDSGLGGLTVARAVRRALPNERLVYLGDTARVPYGTRSQHTVLRYARTCGQHLAKHDIKLLVVACNTVSAVALPMLRVELDVPVLGVIGPGARSGVEATKTHRLGVIATAGTVASGAYPRAVASVSSRTQVIQRAAPLLVPLVEEGWTEGEVPRLVIDRYLAPLLREKIDALVLGCTHYPLLAELIRERAAAHADAPVAVVDSAEATARELSEVLLERGIARQEPGDLRIWVTDRPARFQEEAARFLGESVDGFEVQAIDL